MLEFQQTTNHFQTILFYLIFSSHHKAFKVAVGMSADQQALCADVMSDFNFSIFI